ncbi:hypothetical protein CLV84_0296 [Neolewinella xylanilytica]|uniref:Uncharacterized protein n=1 Tax=Neolewinella xylanilytica TaxID=1514080 RepID=A0A2S6I763_9BACT|nr:hypothetical protein [Neolewinella xylanilytica]PPK87356.1 hypothetical protein CLV84_0296 [Neolewinella xylanilytica]
MVAPRYPYDRYLQYYKNHLFSLLLTALVVTVCTAQRIEAEKVFGGYEYTQNGQMLRMGDLVDRMEPETEAYDLMRSARTNLTIAKVLALPAGALIGWSLSAGIADGDTNWKLAAVGGGLIVAMIPFSSAGNRKSRAAVDLHNERLGFRLPDDRPVFALAATKDGLGRTVGF